MQLTLSGQHFEISEGTRRYLSTKLQRLERHSDHVTNVHVVLKSGRQSQCAEATVHVSGRQLYADAFSSGMHAAIDALVDKLDRQLIRHKEKLTDHHRHEGGRKGHGG